MATTNQIICLSTFEYSTIVDTGPSTIATHCPSCGFRIDVREESFVLLLLGASVYAIYKLSEFCPKMKRISNKFWRILGFEPNIMEPVFFINRQDNPVISFNQSKLRTSGSFDMNDVPDLDLQMTRTSISPFWNQMDINFNFNQLNSFSDKYTDNNLILTPNSMKNITIDRIDEVLTQIDDIKKSIVEIDSQIFDFSGSKCLNFNPDFFTLTNTDLDGEPEDNIKIVIENNCEEEDQTPRTPLQELNLEWDLNDVQSDNMYYNYNDFTVESALSLPVTDADKQKIKSLQELLEEAKQMDLLNNILDAITSKDMDNKSRDSAYFEY